MQILLVSWPSLLLYPCLAWSRSLFFFVFWETFKQKQLWSVLTVGPWFIHGSYLSARPVHNASRAASSFCESFPPPPALALFYEPEGGACMEPMITQGFNLWQPFRELLHPYTSIASFLFQLYISNTKIEAVVLPERSPPGEFLFIGNYVIASDNVVLISWLSKMYHTLSKTPFSRLELSIFYLSA